MATRDEFSSNVMIVLRERVGGFCSNPNCRCTTTGPNDAVLKSTRVGVCAHICAASPRGPRYDATMTQAERTSPSNGIWLCATCAGALMLIVINSLENYYMSGRDRQKKRLIGIWASLDQCARTIVHRSRHFHFFVPLSYRFCVGTNHLPRLPRTNRGGSDARRAKSGCNDRRHARHIAAAFHLWKIRCQVIPYGRGFLE